ncbi:carboxylesterase family protein [Actinomadura rudentiformis]|uniref:Carboxylesterase family protein n=1 Tax=Actinomadura rudentiformis TaxID=359158 RepID=A0A6H9YZ72_9ACTN|nr:carboxylesterase family protein [Actinomadura rudentiformis]KAB2347987.1 carboxylesterase family protein [Actinomadura rudentiformis]
MTGSIGSATAADDESQPGWCGTSQERSAAPSPRLTASSMGSRSPRHRSASWGWRSPQPPPRWSGMRDATTPAPACARSSAGGQIDTTEYCLYLNVTAPSQPHPAGRNPVIVRLHGEGNSYGTAGTVYPRRLAVGGDVVVVTTDYRLGIFDILDHPALDGSGAYGLEDQQAVLRWLHVTSPRSAVTRTKLTLLGQPGGFFDACTQLTSSRARGLFDRAGSGRPSSSVPVPVPVPAPRRAGTSCATAASVRRRDGARR